MSGAARFVPAALPFARSEFVVPSELFVWPEGIASTGSAVAVQVLKIDPPQIAIHFVAGQAHQSVAFGGGEPLENVIELLGADGGPPLAVPAPMISGDCDRFDPSVDRMDLLGAGLGFQRGADVGR